MLLRMSWLRLLHFKELLLDLSLLIRLLLPQSKELFHLHPLKATCVILHGMNALCVILTNRKLRCAVTRETCCQIAPPVRSRLWQVTLLNFLAPALARYQYLFSNEQRNTDHAAMWPRRPFCPCART